MIYDTDNWCVTKRIMNIKLMTRKL